MPGLSEYVKNRFIRQEIRSDDAKRYPWVLKYVFIRFETQYMLNMLRVNMCI